MVISVLYILPYVIFSIPIEQQTKVYSPKRVFVLDQSSIPPSSIELKLYVKYCLPDLDVLPPHLTHLTLYGSIGRPGVVNVPLFPTITYLDLDLEEMGGINGIPPNVTHLVLAGYFDQYIDSFPPSLTHLTFGRCYNQALPKILPSLLHLTFGCEFNQPVDFLPPSLTHLRLRECFNQTIDCLPNSLTHLHLGAAFNQQMEKFPTSLTHLTFEQSRLRWPLNNLPSSLIMLQLFPTTPTQYIDYLPPYLSHLSCPFIAIKDHHTFPPSLTSLGLGFLGQHSLLWTDQFASSLPLTLLQLEISGKFNLAFFKLPPSITHFRFNSIDCIFNQLIDNLFSSTSIKYLQLGRNFNQLVTEIPSSITHLTFGFDFNHPIDNLPHSLTHLALGSRYNLPIDNLPPSLTHLSLGGQFNHPIDQLPPYLQVLSFIQHSMFNQPVDHLPPSLMHLKLGKSFDCPLENLPLTLTHLTIERSFSHSFDKLPLSLTHLSYTGM